MKRFVCFSLFALMSVSSISAAPVFEGDWSRIRRYGHGQDRDLFTEEQLAYIDDNIAYLTTEKIHGTDVFTGGNLDQAAMYTADQLQNTKVLLYLQAFYAFSRWQAVWAENFSNTNLFVYDGGQTDYAFNQGTVEGREFWASISDNVVNTSKVVGTFVDGIGKISSHGHSEWIPEFRETLSQLDGLTIYNGPPGEYLDYSEGLMREDFIEGDAENMRTYLDLFLQVPDDEYMMLNSFHTNYPFALAGFLIVAHDKSFLRLYPAGGNNWNNVLWHCEEYDHPLGPPKGKGVRISDWVYERSFEYADVRLDLENTNSVIIWHESPVVQSRPVADPDSISLDEDTSVAITLSGTDADGNSGTSLTYTVGVQPTDGTLSGSAPDLTYTPDSNFFGSDRFYFIVTDGGTNSYAVEVSITVDPVNDVPEAAAQRLTVRNSESVAVELSGVDADGDDLSYAVEFEPTNGSLTGTAPNLTYRPHAGFTGADSFTFTVGDGLTNSDPASVSITVNQDVTEVIAGYDFDDGSGTATTNATLRDAHVSASHYGVGAGLNPVMNSNANSLAEDLDAEGNIFGTAHPISFGGVRGDFGFTRKGDLANAISTDEFMTLTVTPTDLHGMNLSRLTFRSFADDLLDAANAWALYSSVDGFGLAQAITNGETAVADEWVGHVIDLSAERFQNLTEAVEFRLYIYDGFNNSDSSTLFDKVILHGTTSLDYTRWAAGYGLTGDDALAGADAENDRYDNLAEYALGMNPTNADAGSRDWKTLTFEDGTNWFEYVHYRRVDYVEQGLSYLLIDSTNLVDSVAATNTQDQILVGPAVDGYEAVTNRYESDDSIKFIQLKIGQE